MKISSILSLLYLSFIPVLFDKVINVVLIKLLPRCILLSLLPFPHHTLAHITPSLLFVHANCWQQWVWTDQEVAFDQNFANVQGCAL